MLTQEHFTRETLALTDAMFRLSMSILRNEQDCHDAVQQALINAWAARDRMPQDKFRPYLMRIVINECRNIQRQRMRVLPVAELPERPDMTDHGPSELQEAITLLPEILRTPLLLKYMEGFSEKETARILNIPVTAVKNRLFRARRALKERLTDWGVSG